MTWNHKINKINTEKHVYFATREYIYLHRLHPAAALAPQNPLNEKYELIYARVKV
ncbi:hypothetical protein BH10PAT3_BH10PAT3_0550 [soil metagenome]